MTVQYNFMLAGTQSGCGKTSMTLALLQKLVASDYAVQSFKSGPDFLDPMWHQAVTQQHSYNLDTRMMGETHVQQLFSLHAKQFNIIEGVMGLFDGAGGVGKVGSSLDLARTLDIPILLVVDAKGMSGSIVPLVAGFCMYAAQTGVAIHGVLANRVGSMRHVELLSEVLNQHDLPPLLGWMKKNAPTLPERHLGLQRPEEVPLPDFSQDFFLDLESLKIPSSIQQRVTDPACPASTKSIAITKDSAFCFMYQANLDWLQQQGYELTFFSPLVGEPVPDADALWLVGGYPELYAELLSKSASWSSIHQFIESGKKVLAECGGLMVLGQSLCDKAGHIWPMAGILPFEVRMQESLASLGYRQHINGMCGHEFHHSKRFMHEKMPAAFELEGRGDTGIAYHNLRASYVHWYFPTVKNMDWLL